METVNIETSHNISIEQPIASIGDRIVATLLDFLIQLGYIFTILIIGTATGILGTTYMIIAGLPYMFYHLIFEFAMEGQTIGKKAMKIKVVKIDGTEPDFVSYFLRWIFRTIDIYLLFGAVSILLVIINGKQRLGDIAAATTVIRIKPAVNQLSIYSQIPENYSITFPEVYKLSPKDIYTIKEVLKLIYSANYSQKSVTLVKNTKANIEKAIGTNSEMKPIEFLQTIINDYNYTYMNRK